MINHPTLEETAALAGMLHAAQRDKAGQPYIGHLARAARHLVHLFPDANYAERHAIWLHDSIEDTGMDAAQLSALGYSEGVIAIVAAVTRTRESGAYLDWIKGIAQSGSLSAIRVKLADLTDNSDPERLAGLGADKAASLGKRYAAAKSILFAAVEKLSPFTDDDDLPAEVLVPLTLDLTPYEVHAFDDAANKADRSPREFILEESLWLAEMLALMPLGQVRLARHHRKEQAVFIGALRKIKPVHEPIAQWARSQGYSFRGNDGQTGEE